MEGVAGRYGRTRCPKSLIGLVLTCVPSRMGSSSIKSGFDPLDLLREALG